jgi:hypothetical protein
MKRKHLSQRLIELIFPRSCAERYEFRVALAKNKRSATRLERTAKQVAVAVADGGKT